MSRRLSAIVALALVAAAFAVAHPLPADAAGPTMPPDFNDQLVTNVAKPTALAFTPDGRVLITTMTGQLRVVTPGAGLLTTPALDVGPRSCAIHERGMLGAAVDPGFATSHSVFLFYTVKNGSICGQNVDPYPYNRVSRFTLPDSNVIDPASEVVILDHIPSRSGHNAGDIHFGADGLLYISTGDGACRLDPSEDTLCTVDNNNSRSDSQLLGKILRVAADGSIPNDNPNVGRIDSRRCGDPAAASVVSGSGPCLETFASGLRNPFRFAVRPGTSDLYINDVGEQSWDEIDLGAAGADYGWNLREGHCAVGSTTDCGPPPAGLTNRSSTTPGPAAAPRSPAGHSCPPACGPPPSTAPTSLPTTSAARSSASRPSTAAASPWPTSSAASAPAAPPASPSGPPPTASRSTTRRSPAAARSAASPTSDPRRSRQRPRRPPPPRRRPHPRPRRRRGRPAPDTGWSEPSGTVYPFGDAKPYGNAATTTAVDLEPTPSGNGYWVVDDQGRVFAFGDAVARGNVDRAKLSPGEKVTSLSATAAGDGYWVFTTKGRVLTFGAAPFFGDVSNLALAGPVLDSIPTPTGRGYYMVASDGGIFAFGDATFYGSMGGKALNAPVQSLVPDSDGVGYWLVASDGGIFAFQADFQGSMGAAKLNKPITGMVRAGHGYLMVGEDGGIFDFSATPDGFKGSLGANPPARPIASVALLAN